MLLAVDAGNTNTVFAVFDGETLNKSWRLQTNARRSADEYAVFLKDVLALLDLDFNDIDGVIIGSVVPDANMHLEGLSIEYLDTKPVFVSKNSIDLTIDLDNPSEVGADRLVNAVAVNKEHKTPAIVIDFGTATTFDVIDEHGAYAGGVIAPGINLSIDALHQAAAKLPKISVQKPDAVIGKNTVDAMRSGLFYGYKNLIEGMIEQISGEMSAKPLILATGGLAPLFAEECSVIDLVDQELTLKGLYHIYKDQSA